MRITAAVFVLLAAATSSADAFAAPSRQFSIRGGRCVEYFEHQGATLAN